MSEANNEEGKSSNGQIPIRLRSRFPKAMPNIAASSGINRIRRLSGHVSSAQAPPPSTTPSAITPSINTEPSVEFHVEKAPPETPDVQIQTIIKTSIENVASSSLSSAGVVQVESRDASISRDESTKEYHQASQLSRPRVPLVSKLNSTSISLSPAAKTNIDETLLAQSTINTSSLTFRQYVNYQAHILNQAPGVSLVPLSPSVLNQPPTPIIMPQTPGGSIYKPKFSNEQIMNIIKYRALQKLKKIESESLREKRRKYQMELKSVEAETTTMTNGAQASTGVSDRSKMRMRDLLYYSPKTKKSESVEIVEEKADDVEIIVGALDTSIPRLNRSVSNSSFSNDSIAMRSLEDSLASNESVPPPQPPTPQQEQKEEQATASPVKPTFNAPQLKFAEDGSIIINEESLVIQRVETEPVYDSTVVESENVDNLTYNSYRKFHHTKKWNQKETAKFYKALSMIGTDFTMIQKLFPNRNRDEIKRKFKREEKLNQALIDKILSKTLQIDLSVFVPGGSSDDEKKKGDAEENAKFDGNDEAKGGTENDEKKKKRVRKSKNETTTTTEKTENGVSEKKPRKKLKRIQKREFVGAESDDEIKSSKKKITDEKIEISPDTNPFQKKSPNRPDLNNVCLSPLPPCSTLLDTSLTEPFQTTNVSFLDNSIIYRNLEEEEVEDDELNDTLVLDLDNNTIITNKTVMNVEYQFKSEEEKNFLIENKTNRTEPSIETNSAGNKNDENEEDEDEENLILDLDNNTIISNNAVLNMDFNLKNDNDAKQAETQPKISQTKSKIVITKINHNTNN